MVFCIHHIIQRLAPSCPSVERFSGAENMLSDLRITLSTLQNFATSMKGFECTLFDISRRNERSTTVQNCLGIGSSGPLVTWQPTSALTTNDSGKVCSVISAYRLLDVVAMLNGAQRAPSVPRRYFEPPNKSFRVKSKFHKHEISFLKPLQGLDKLANWPKILLDFRKMLKRSDRPVDVAPPDLPTPFRLLRQIVGNDSTQRYTAIEANFLYAALHIACMKELRFHRETCPDLPDNFDGLVRS